MNFPVPPSVSDGLPLAVAMVTSATMPLLLIDGDLDVVAASNAFCRDFNVNPAQVGGRAIFSLGRGEWDSPRLRSLLTAVASGGARVEDYELDLNLRERGARRLCLSAHRVDYDDRMAVRLLVSITDV
jgi:PAS domain-containing protein